MLLGRMSVHAIRTFVAGVSHHPNLVPSPNISVPMLFISGTGDTTGATPIAKQMFASAGVSGPKALYIIKDQGTKFFRGEKLSRKK